MIEVRLKRWWLSNPPEKVMRVTSGEAQLLVNNGTADYVDVDLNPAPDPANKAKRLRAAR